VRLVARERHRIGDKGPDEDYDPRMKQSDEDAIARLDAAGLRHTPVRLGVLGLLARSSQPLDAQQVLQGLANDSDAVTVYRTLNTFTRKKLVHRVRGADRSWKYALERPRKAHGHPHFVCDACGQVECLSLLKIPGTLSRSLKLDQTYAVAYTEVMVHGVCPRCR
jgi:Fur family ferric uptake transcriptional regulator